ncbi:endo alpha-1,4 polygalactosaminidase [Candidatus Peregrinibacteria bacterium]|nr:endo alpha-1,4 polygalactosaminidase [Candidatus Peregrinibacteria bacterium]
MFLKLFRSILITAILFNSSVTIAATQNDWYRPTINTTWQWQLTGKINTNYNADVYDIDLFDTPVQTISFLKLSEKKVLCYFSAGSSEKWRPDFNKFNTASMGKSLSGWAGEKWLDIRSKNVRDMVSSRLDLAVTKGCTGVEPDNVDGYTNKTGFALTKNDQLNFNRYLANEAHKRGLTIALKNAGDLADELVDYFDLSVNEECHRYNECDQLAVFTQQGKPIFNAEYKFNKKICQQSLKENIRTIFLSRKLDDSSRKSCD